MTRQASQERTRLCLPRFAWVLFAFLAGLAYAVWLIGWRPLDVTDVGWMRGDIKQAHLGWAFLRLEPWPQWPLLWSSHLNYPLGISLSYLDPVPLVALLLRPFSIWLPQDFQYLGWWLVLCAALQFGFGIILSRRLGATTPWAIALGGVFFLFAPIFTWRIHGHMALSAHWLLLASFVLLATPTARCGGRRIWLSWLALLALAGGINPYFAAMSLLLLAAFGYRCAALRAMKPMGALAMWSAGFAVCLTSLFFFGFIAFGAGARFGGPGLGSHSANLLALLDAGASGALLGRSLPSWGVFQWEGNGYLGAGVFLLLIAALLVWRKVAQPNELKPLIGLLLILAIALLIALSPQITFGPYVLIDLMGALPDPLLKAWSVFRASGRFVWLLHYALIAFALVLLYRIRRQKTLLPLLLLGFALQVADLMPLRESIRRQLHREEGTTLVDRIWQAAGESYKHLVLLPAWQCSRFESPLGELGFWEWGLTAYRAGMTLNSLYAARTGQDWLEYNCDELVNGFIAGDRDQDALYVIADQIARAALLRHGLAGCRLADGLTVCGKGAQGESGAIAWQDYYPIFVPGLPLVFDHSRVADPYLAGGWAPRDAEHPELRVQGREGRLIFRLVPAPATDLFLRLDFRRTAPGGTYPIALLVNGQRLVERDLGKSQESAVIQVVIAADLQRPDGLLEIAVRLLDSQSLIADPDRLAETPFALTGLSLRPAQP